LQTVRFLGLKRVLVLLKDGANLTKRDFFLSPPSVFGGDFRVLEISIMNTKNTQQGFTLIELMIVVAIIGILASIALPAYETYAKKSKFTEVILAISPIKTAVELCGQTTVVTNFKTDCINGQHGVKNVAATGNVKSVEVIAGGANNKVVITATSQNIGSVDKTYILTGTLTNGQVSWAKTGTCVTAQWC